MAGTLAREIAGLRQVGCRFYKWCKQERLGDNGCDKKDLFPKCEVYQKLEKEIKGRGVMGTGRKK